MGAANGKGSGGSRSTPMTPTKTDGSGDSSPHITKSSINVKNTTAKSADINKKGIAALIKPLRAPGLQIRPGQSISEFNVMNLASTLSQRFSVLSGLSFISLVSAPTMADTARRKITRTRYRGGSISGPGKTAWPVAQTELLFLPEFPVGTDQKMQLIFYGEVSRGAFGQVFHVQCSNTLQHYAMKVLAKSQVCSLDVVKQVKQEVMIQQMCSHHPFITPLTHHWQTRKLLIVMTEYVAYGELHQLWQSLGTLPENLVALYIAEIAVTIDFLHNAGVIYRDLKMENLLLDEDGHIKLIDFGLAKWLKYGGRTGSICGTLHLMAPEVCAGTFYDHSVDWWSLGIISYCLVVGHYPIPLQLNHTAMVQAIAKCSYTLPSNTSTALVSLVSGLLERDPSRRTHTLHALQREQLYSGIDLAVIVEKRVAPRKLLEEFIESRTRQNFEDFAGLTSTPKRYQKDSQDIYPGSNHLHKLSSSPGINHAGMSSPSLKNSLHSGGPCAVINSIGDKNSSGLGFHKRSASSPLLHPGRLGHHESQALKGSGIGGGIGASNGAAVPILQSPLLRLARQRCMSQAAARSSSRLSGGAVGGRPAALGPRRLQQQQQHVHSFVNIATLPSMPSPSLLHSQRVRDRKQRYKGSKKQPSLPTLPQENSTFDSMRMSSSTNEIPSCMEESSSSTSCEKLFSLHSYHANSGNDSETSSKKDVIPRPLSAEYPSRIMASSRNSVIGVNIMSSSPPMSSSPIHIRGMGGGLSGGGSMPFVSTLPPIASSPLPPSTPGSSPYPPSSPLLGRSIEQQIPSRYGATLLPPPMPGVPSPVAGVSQAQFTDVVTSVTVTTCFNFTATATTTITTTSTTASYGAGGGDGTASVVDVVVRDSSTSTPSAVDTNCTHYCSSSVAAAVSVTLESSSSSQNSSFVFSTSTSNNDCSNSSKSVPSVSSISSDVAVTNSGDSNSIESNSSNGGSACSSSSSLYPPTRIGPTQVHFTHPPSSNVNCGTRRALFSIDADLLATSVDSAATSTSTLSHSCKLQTGSVISNSSSSNLCSTLLKTLNPSMKTVSTSDDNSSPAASTVTVFSRFVPLTSSCITTTTSASSSPLRNKLDSTAVHTSCQLLHSPHSQHACQFLHRLEYKKKQSCSMSTLDNSLFSEGPQNVSALPKGVVIDRRTCENPVLSGSAFAASASSDVYWRGSDSVLASSVALGDVIAASPFTTAVDTRVIVTGTPQANMSDVSKVCSTSVISTISVGSTTVFMPGVTVAADGVVCSTTSAAVIVGSDSEDKCLSLPPSSSSASANCRILYKKFSYSSSSSGGGGTVSTSAIQCSSSTDDTDSSPFNASVTDCASRLEQADGAELPCIQVDENFGKENQCLEAILGKRVLVPESEANPSVSSTREVKNSISSSGDKTVVIPLVIESSFCNFPVESSSVTTEKTPAVDVLKLSRAEKFISFQRSKDRITAFQNDLLKYESHHPVTFSNSNDTSTSMTSFSTINFPLTDAKKKVPCQMPKIRTSPLMSFRTKNCPSSISNSATVTSVLHSSPLSVVRTSPAIRTSPHFRHSSSTLATSPATLAAARSPCNLNTCYDLYNSAAFTSRDVACVNRCSVDTSRTGGVYDREEEEGRGAASFGDSLQCPFISSLHTSRSSPATLSAFPPSFLSDTTNFFISSVDSAQQYTRSASDLSGVSSIHSHVTLADNINVGSSSYAARRPSFTENISISKKSSAFRGPKESGGSNSSFAVTDNDVPTRAETLYWSSASSANATDDGVEDSVNTNVALLNNNIYRIQQ